MASECTDEALADCGISKGSLSRRSSRLEIRFRPYQLDGIKWLIGCCNAGHGGILADEMGLGKTCQTIAFLIAVSKKACGIRLGGVGVWAAGRVRHLVVCPLSIVRGWQEEFKRFAPTLAVLTYMGSKDERLLLQQCTSMAAADVVLTTYEHCIKDGEYLKRLGTWQVVVVDEGHRLKNSESMLHNMLLQFPARCRILLTGTPIQNNLTEMYSLLSFVNPDVFDIVKKDEFLATYATAAQDTAVATALQKKVHPYLLRRTKAVVAVDIPPKAEVIVYHDITELQKKYYKAVLMRDHDAFQSANRTRLLNVLMQLRKCVDHPYLFDGVEPEPFEAGEHLVAASGKLVVLDALLSRLHVGGHRVLVFSQMTRMLDILQDYVTYRGYKYERLDGSVRGEERFIAVRNFSDEDTFIFLLSSRAGGQGLNLTGADTVIFYDSDFNPQVDLQAAARAHRIGQTRPVKVLRLVARNTVEEVIMHRARGKLKLTEAVMDTGGSESSSGSALSVALTSSGGQQLRDALKLGLDKLFSSDDGESLKTEASGAVGCGCDVTAVLGESVDGRWVHEPSISTETRGEELADLSDEAKNTAPSTIYEFEGKDYSLAVAAGDRMFDELVNERLQDVHLSGRLRSDQPAIGVKSSAGLCSDTLAGGRQRRVPLTAEELAERQKKRAEAAARRAAKEAADEQRRAEYRRQKLEMLWEKNGYVSCKIESDGESSSSSEEEGDGDLAQSTAEAISVDSAADKERSINYVSGDVTRPVTANDVHNAIIVHCVDDSGSWGSGGVFGALSSVSPLPAARYELAMKMKDLALGDVHLVDLQTDDTVGRSPAEVKKYVALVVAQRRDRSGRLSGVRLDALETAFRRIRRATVRLGGRTSVHLPRIGYNTPNFNWYGTERLIRKVLVTEGGLDTFIYYYPRRLRGEAHRRRRRSLSSAESEPSAGPTSDDQPSDAKVMRVAAVDVSHDAHAGTSSRDVDADWCCEVIESGNSGDQPQPASAEAPLPRLQALSGDAGATPCSQRVPAKVMASSSDVFADVSVAFDISVGAAERERLRRLTLSHGGEVHDGGLRANTTYVIADERVVDKETVLARCRSLATPSLRSQWLDDCVQAGEQLDITEYLLS